MLYQPEQVLLVECTYSERALFLRLESAGSRRPVVLGQSSRSRTVAVV